MRGAILIVFLLALSAAIVTGSLSEDEYGTNLARVHAQAEVNWVKDTHYVIFDFQDHSNKMVSSLSDQRIAHILKHPKSREEMGITAEKVAPYLREVKIEEGLIEPKNDTVKNVTKNNTDNIAGEEPEAIEIIDTLNSPPDKITECSSKFSYEPFGLGKSLSLKILERSRLGTRYCLA